MSLQTFMTFFMWNKTRYLSVFFSLTHWKPMGSNVVWSSFG